MQQTFCTWERHQVVVARLVAFWDVKLILLADAKEFAVVYLSHQLAEDRQGSPCTLTECHASEVDVSVITAHPAGNHQFGAETDEPTVGIAVRRTCLAAQVASDVVGTTTQGATCTFVDDCLEHVDHLASLLLREHLVHARGEVGDDVAVGILNASDEQGRVVDTHAGEDGVGTCHLTNAHVA